MSTSSSLLSLSEQVRLVQEGKISAVALVQTQLDEINRLNPKLNSFITVDADGALEQARAIDEARENGARLGPLAGATIGVKDSIPTKGLRTTDNSRLLENWIPQEDASTVKPVSYTHLTLPTKA